MELVIRVLLAVECGLRLRWKLVGLLLVLLGAVGGLIFAQLGGSFWMGVGYVCTVCAAVYVVLTAVCGLCTEFY